MERDRNDSRGKGEPELEEAGLRKKENGEKENRSREGQDEFWEQW